jgi:hypothetical protein
MMNRRDLHRAVRHGERELRAAGGDMLSQLRPKNIVRDACDLALKFTRDEVLQAYLASRVWPVLAMVLVFVLVSAVCGIYVMFKAVRFIPGIVALPVGMAVSAGGLVGQAYVLAIWLEERAAERDRAERGVSIDIPGGILAYLKYSRALVPWIAVCLFVALPLLIMATRGSPLVALMLFTVSLLAPVLFWKFDT